MKILVLSDSHGNISNMKKAVEISKPDMIFHLGDCFPDGEKLRIDFPTLPFHQVVGNCDRNMSEPAEQLITLEGKRILLCHGHTYGVKSSLLNAGLSAQQQEIDLFLFGHTHRPFCEKRGNTTFFNPGSIGDLRFPSFGILMLENGSEIQANNIILDV